MYGYWASERGTGTIRPKLLKSITNFASKREQSRTCSSYAEREQNVLRSKRITEREEQRDKTNHLYAASKSG